MLNEKNFLLNDINVKYRFKWAESDRPHLLIIFSGFRVPTMTGYDFTGDSHKAYKGNILWINDDFNNLCSYYLCQNMNFSIEDAVIALIEHILEQCGLQKSQCTLAGFSKGGTAALYFGIKYGFVNVLSTVPQFYIGSYVQKNWPTVALGMMGDNISNNVTTLNSLLPDLIDQDVQHDKNIYLFSSLVDIQYESEIEPNLKKLAKYKNFNLVMTNSELVCQHNHVTRYNLSLILSILYSLCEGVIPRYGMITKNGGRGSNKSAIPISKKIVAKLNKCRFENDFFFPEGDGFILGEDSSCYGLQKKTLILKRDSEEYSFSIGSVINKDLSSNYFSKKYIDYNTGGFASLGYKGVSLSHLPCGIYDLSLGISSKTYEGIADLVTEKKINTQGSSGEFLYYIYSDSVNVRLVKRSIFGCYSQDVFSKVTNQWLKDGLFHVEGIFRVLGVELTEWNDAQYFLILKGQNEVVSFSLGMCHRELITKQYGDGFSNYNKAYFSTLAGKGVDLSCIVPGCYEVYISMLHGNTLFTAQIIDNLNICALG